MALKTTDKEKSSSLDEKCQTNSSWPDKCNLLKKRLCVNTTFVILSLVTVVLCITLLCLTIKWRQNRIQAVQPKHEKVCFECEIIASENLIADFRSPGSNDTQCCGYLEDILDKLVAKVVEQRYSSEVVPRVNIGPKCENNVVMDKSAANLIDINKTIFRPEDGASLVVMKIDSPSFFHSDIKYENGKFVINEGGYYFVSSKLRMKINSTNEEVQRYNHYVYHYSHKTKLEGLLLENTETPCKPLESSFEMTSSIEAVFKLDKLDLVYVAITRPEYLQMGHSNVFSINLVSSL